MRTVIFWGAIIVAFAINKNWISSEDSTKINFIAIITMCSIAMDIIEFAHNLTKK